MTEIRIPNPQQPLPSPMTALDPTSWAYETVTRRWPEIANRIFNENELPKSIKPSLKTLISDIPDAPIRAIHDLGAPDAQVWNQYIRVHAGKNWLEPPWFFTEHYFYRRLIEVIGYFQNGEGKGFDPFVFQKHQGLETSLGKIRDLAGQVDYWKNNNDEQENLMRLIYLDLWGNQADLSMWPAQGVRNPEHQNLDQASEFLLEDRTKDVAAHILHVRQENVNKEGIRIDFLVDNAGFELVSDLMFSDYLLTSGIAKFIRLHVKPHPTYVSDAMIKDVIATLDFFKVDSNIEVRELGLRLVDNLAQGRLQIRENFFWTSPLPGWEIPSSLKIELSRSSLVISKGDANYRRLLGDLNWPKTTKFTDILAYFPVPIVALRTVKAEIACGMQPGQSRHVAAKDPSWMTNGRWGMIQFLNPKTKHV
jgi:uncharacterized protein with ATP-grasp and redox domains